MPKPKLPAALLIGLGLVVGSAQAEPPNKILGTWRMVSAQIDPEGNNLPAYGPAPKSLLVFTADMHFVEVLTDSTVPKFASKARGTGRRRKTRWPWRAASASLAPSPWMSTAT